MRLKKCWGSASVELDDLLLLEELGEVFSLGESDDFALHVLHIGFDVSRDCSAFVVVVSSDVSARLSISDLNDIADLELERCDVDDSAINQDVAVAHHLSGLEDRLCITESPDSGCESKLEEAKEVKAGVATHSLCLLERVRELLLEHVVIAADDLLCEELLAVFRLSSILEVRTVLTERVCALGCRALRSSPNVIADGAADVRFSSSISCHSRVALTQP